MFPSVRVLLVTTLFFLYLPKFYGCAFHSEILKYQINDEINSTDDVESANSNNNNNNNNNNDNRNIRKNVTTNTIAAESNDNNSMIDAGGNSYIDSGLNRKEAGIFDNKENLSNGHVKDSTGGSSSSSNKDDDYEEATESLTGIYTECLLQLSLPCMQRKFLIFLDRLSRLRSFRLLGGFLSVVRVKKEAGPVLKEADLEARLGPNDAQSVLSALTEITVGRFLHSHVFRITLPSGMTASLAGNSRSMIDDTIDINIARSLDYSTARGKGDKKMKKFFHMMVTGLMGKMAFLGPFMVLLIKLKALKALILSKIALIMSLLQLFKSKKGGGQSGKEVIIVHDSHGGGGGGGGHESYSGGGGGWSSGGGGWSGGNAGWISGGHGDSYSSGVHSGGGDSTYIGGSDYAGHGGGGWSAGAAAGGGGHGWGRKSSSDPQLMAYRAYIPETDEEQ